MKINSKYLAGRMVLGNGAESIVVSCKFTTVGLFQVHNSAASYIQIEDLDTLDRLIHALQDVRKMYTKDNG
jgi:hypothetical protein